MNRFFLSAVFATLGPALMVAQESRSASMGTFEAGGPGIEQKLAMFEITDKTVMEALSALSRVPNINLHLGIEDLLRPRMSDPVDRTVRLTIKLENTTGREILDALCGADPRYAWSLDQSTTNVYPAARGGDSTDLLNFRVEQITLANVPDPDQALTPLSKIFPGEQIGYFHLGPDNDYPEPWTFSFEHITVRQFINRVTEHVGPKTSWIWQGGKDARMFDFIKGGFHRA